MMKYDLVGIDGNAYYVMGYTSKALKAEGLGDKVDEMMQKAMSSDYNHLLMVCMEYIDMANEAAVNNVPDKDDEEDW